MTALEKHNRRSAVLILLGVAILLATLLWKHPLSFMAFLGLGCPLILIGILHYLYAIASSRIVGED
jgi:hypothetical protein